MSWKNTNNRYILFLDIMGFKHLVASHKHSDVLKRMSSLIEVVNSLDNKTFGKKEKLLLRTSVFSDSIILITNGSTINDALHIQLSAMFIMEHCFENGIPIKGCLAYGKFTADFENSLFFGQPLIDAYLLQEEMKMYSIVIHHTYEAKLKDKKVLGKPFKNNYRWTEFNTPFSSGKAKHFHLNWATYLVMMGERKKEYFENGLELFKNKMSGKHRSYFDFTSDFILKQLDD